MGVAIGSDGGFITFRCVCSSHPVTNSLEKTQQTTTPGRHSIETWPEKEECKRMKGEKARENEIEEMKSRWSTPYIVLVLRMFSSFSLSDCDVNCDLCLRGSINPSNG